MPQRPEGQWPRVSSGSKAAELPVGEGIAAPYPLNQMSSLPVPLVSGARPNRSRQAAIALSFVFLGCGAQRRTQGTFQRTDSVLQDKSQTEALGPSSALITFAPQTIDTMVGAYQVSSADMNNDGIADITAVSGSPGQVAWYEAPLWKKHIVNVPVERFMDAAVADADNNGVADIAIASRSTKAPSLAGQLQWMNLLPEKRDGKSVIKEVGRMPASHRVRWADINGDGAAELISAPYMGESGKTPNEAAPAPMTAYSLNAQSSRKGQSSWVPSVVSNELHLLHAVKPIDWAGDGVLSLLTASKEGIRLHRFNAVKGSWNSHSLGNGVESKGSGEVSVGTLVKRGLSPANDPNVFVAAIEPAHGNILAIYRNGSHGWERKELDTTLTEGHALAVADFDGDGIDEIVVGQKEGSRDLLLYRAKDANGSAWTRQVIEANHVGAAGISVNDFNQDGRADLVVAGQTTNNVRLYTNTTAAPASYVFKDDFNNKMGAGWKWLDEVPEAWNVRGGRVNVQRFAGKGFYGINAKIPVLHRPNVPFRKGLEMQVKVGFDVDRPYGQAGFIVYYDNDRYAKYVIEYWYNLGIHVIFLREDNGVPCHCKGTCEKDVFIGKAAVDLKLHYDGKKFITSYRLEGETAWTHHFEVDAIKNEGPVNIGLFSQADSGSKDWAWFDDFQLTVPSEIPAVAASHSR
jgi:regulation of enolase protein 1 (concanavalin A-like superfamily)